ncbi:MAG: leucine-rich repeat domain-containing protein [Clostridia bacterium]|nr:leucine-rich repeat domain-containing protein [Clostridia bacterium]
MLSAMISLRKFLFLIFTATLTACLILALSGCFSLDYDPVVSTSDGVLKYRGTESELSVTGFIDEPEEVVIPESVDGIKVTGIARGAFNGCESLKSVKIPLTVTAISQGAFKNCPNLIIIEVAPDNPEYLSAGNCIIVKETSTLEIACNGSYITEDFSVKKVASGAFEDLDGLEELNFINGLEEIEEDAFKNCIGLKKIALPETLEKLGGCAFLNCTSLTQIDLPQTLKAVEAGTFNGCTSLESLTLPSSVDRIGSSAFYGCESLTSFTVSDGVKEIGEAVFGKCSSLQSLTLPFVGITDGKNSKYNVLFGSLFGYDGYKNSYYAVQNTNIRDYVDRFNNQTFYLPQSLESVTVTGGKIPECAFFNCKYIKSITLEDDVEAIGDYAFYLCENLEEVVIPDDILSIGQYAFFNTAIYKDNSNRENGLLYIGRHLIKGEIRWDKPYCTLRADTLTIADHALSDNANLSFLTLPEGLISIGNYAVSGCQYLHGINIPASVKRIGEAPFAGCSWLDKMEYITVEAGNTGYYAVDNCLIERSTGRLLAGITSSVIPADGSIKEIGREAFYDCNMDEVVIPDGVTKLSNSSFRYCKMQTVTLPKSLTEIEQWSFLNCENLTQINYDGTVAQWYAVKKWWPWEEDSTFKVVCTDGVLEGTDRAYKTVYTET